MNPADFTRTRIFDHVSVEMAAPGPWKIRTRSRDGWTDIDVDTFEVPGRKPAAYDLHFRAGGLGPAGSEIPPGTRWRVVASSGGDRREGFLVEGESVQSAYRLEAGAMHGPVFRLDFPGGSGFFSNLRMTGVSLKIIDALRLQFDARLFGLVKVYRDESDFRWQVKSLEAGSQCALRRSDASVRALVRYVDPHPQNMLVCGNTILQKVELAIPQLIMQLGADVTLRNGFELPQGTEILLPGGSSLRPVVRVEEELPYDWILLANPAGAILHWLELPGPAVHLRPMLYVHTDSGRAIAGYRIRQIDKSWSEAAGGAGTVSLVQNLAVLGGPGWYEALRKPEFAAALARSLDEQPSPWTARLEALP